MFSSVIHITDLQIIRISEIKLFSVNFYENKTRFTSQMTKQYEPILVGFFLDLTENPDV
jgi:hypothetical protein